MLVHGVTWNSDSPALKFHDGGEFTDVALARGCALGLRVLPELWCLGHTKVQRPGEHTHVPRRSGSPAERGPQCGACLGGRKAPCEHLG
ncbi:hypothetical protein ACW4FP_13620 [Paenarthrobacter ureafaciens]